VDRPRVSTVLSLYFYYKTGCQVLLVKRYDEYLGVSGIAYWNLSAAWVVVVLVIDALCHSDHVDNGN
jgi:hypothetical protein